MWEIWPNVNPFSQTTTMTDDNNSGKATDPFVSFMLTPSSRSAKLWENTFQLMGEELCHLDDADALYSVSTSVLPQFGIPPPSHTARRHKNPVQSFQNIHSGKFSKQYKAGSQNQYSQYKTHFV